MLKELDLFRTKQYFAKESEYKHYPELVGAFYEESGNKKEPRRHVWRIDNRRDKKAKRLYELSLYEYKKAEVKDHEVHYIPTSETKKCMSWSLK